MKVISSLFRLRLFKASLLKLLTMIWNMFYSEDLPVRWGHRASDLYFLILTDLWEALKTEITIFIFLLFNSCLAHIITINWMSEKTRHDFFSHLFLSHQWEVHWIRRMFNSVDKKCIESSLCLTKLVFLLTVSCCACCAVYSFGSKSRCNQSPAHWREKKKTSLHNMILPSSFFHPNGHMLHHHSVFFCSCTATKS